jgi:hypothetical protein
VLLGDKAKCGRCAGELPIEEVSPECYNVNTNNTNKGGSNDK